MGSEKETDIAEFSVTPTSAFPGEMSDMSGRVVSGNPVGKPAINAGVPPPLPPPQPNRLMLASAARKTIPA